MAYKHGSVLVIDDNEKIDWNNIKNKPDPFAPTGDVAKGATISRTLGSGDLTGVYSFWGWKFDSNTSFRQIHVRYRSNCNCSSNCNCYC